MDSGRGDDCRGAPAAAVDALRLGTGDALGAGLGRGVGATGLVEGVGLRWDVVGGLSDLVCFTAFAWWAAFTCYKGGTSVAFRLGWRAIWAER